MSTHGTVIGTGVAVTLLGLRAAAAAGPGGYTLTASPTTVAVGGMVRVCWTSPLIGTTSTDWIAMYFVGNPNTQYLAYQYNSTAATSGCLDFAAPGFSGVIEFRYLLVNGYTSTATSNTVNVTCAADSHCHDGDPCTINKCIAGACQYPNAVAAMVELTASAGKVPLHGTVSACWEIPAHVASTLDWIGLYTVGAPNPFYHTFQYTGGLASGCLHFTAGPNEGMHEFRYMPQNGYCDFAVSETVVFCDATTAPDCPCTVAVECNDEDPCTTDACTGGACSNTAPDPLDYSLTFCPPEVSGGARIEVCWTAPEGSSGSDWVAIYPVGANPFGYLSYFYTFGATQGCRSLAAPPGSGDYEFRYLLLGGYCTALASVAWEVCAGCSPDDFMTARDFVDCLRGPAVVASLACAHLDLDCDDNVDLHDVSIFQAQFAGP